MSYHPPPVSITAYIALGSNLGDREHNLRTAIACVDVIPQVSVTQVSSLLENPAVGGPTDSPPFLNAAAELQTDLDAAELMDRLLKVEQKLGRYRGEKWGPRTIDLDLLLYGNQTINTPSLIVPHPLMHQRRFVLTPLAEIAPHAQHPLLKKTIAQLLNRLQSPAPADSNSDNKGDGDLF